MCQLSSELEAEIDLELEDKLDNRDQRDSDRDRRENDSGKWEAMARMRGAEGEILAVLVTPNRDH